MQRMQLEFLILQATTKSCGPGHSSFPSFFASLSVRKLCPLLFTFSSSSSIFYPQKTKKRMNELHHFITLLSNLGRDSDLNKPKLANLWNCQFKLKPKTSQTWPTCEIARSAQVNWLFSKLVICKVFISLVMKTIQAGKCRSRT